MDAFHQAESRMEIRGKRFVVIGGAGLIGSHTVDALVREDVAEIAVYDNFVRGTPQNLDNAVKDKRVRVFELGGDILQTDILDAALKGADGVFHFAALWLLHCHDYPQSAFETNIRGTFNVLQACVANNIKRLVYSSSASVYGDALQEPMTEDHPLNGVNFYGATKIAGEAMARAYAHRYKLPVVGLRYMNVYGPRQDYRGAYVAVIMKMLDAIDAERPIPVYGDGSQAYDFVHVRDCADANICAMKADTTDRFYNVGTGVRTSIKELAEMLLEMVGTKVGIEYHPAGLTFVKNRISCPKRAKSEIGFSAKVSLREGLESLVHWRQRDREAVALRRRAIA
jgi:UDP-glucose 4-epimerase